MLVVLVALKMGARAGCAPPEAKDAGQCGHTVLTFGGIETETVLQVRMVLTLCSYKAASISENSLELGVGGPVCDPGCSHEQLIPA